jgi:hypothetical protein
MTVPVVREDPFENLRPFIPRKVNVDIRRIVTARIQEPLEEQIVSDRIDMRDPQAVRHDGGSG